MANPNIVSVATIAGGSVGGHLTTSLVAFLTVTAEYLLKVNSIIVANVDGTNAATCDIQIVKLNVTPLGITNYDVSGTFYIAKTVNVPADDILVVVDKPFYLMETDVLKAKASAASDLDIFISYDVIID
jgi:hypothetical protein